MILNNIIKIKVKSVIKKPDTKCQMYNFIMSVNQVNVQFDYSYNYEKSFNLILMFSLITQVAYLNNETIRKVFNKSEVIHLKLYVRIKIIVQQNPSGLYQ